MSNGMHAAILGYRDVCASVLERLRNYESPDLFNSCRFFKMTFNGLYKDLGESDEELQQNLISRKTCMVLVGFSDHGNPFHMEVGFDPTQEEKWVCYYAPVPGELCSTDVGEVDDSFVERMHDAVEETQIGEVTSDKLKFLREKIREGFREASEDPEAALGSEGTLLTLTKDGPIEHRLDIS